MTPIPYFTFFSTIFGRYIWCTLRLKHTKETQLANGKNNNNDTEKEKREKTFGQRKLLYGCVAIYCSIIYDSVGGGGDGRV